MLMMLIDLKSMIYPLFSLSELPDRFVGFNLSPFGHPLISYTTVYAVSKVISKLYAFQLNNKLCKLLMKYKSL